MRNLAAKLGTDGTAAARDQHRLVLQIAADLLHIEVNFVAAQKIENIHIAHRRVFNIAFQDLIKRRDGFQLTAGLCADAQNVLTVLFFRRGNRQNNLVYVVASGHAGDTLPTARHFHAVNARPALALIVVDRHNGNAFALRCGFHVLDNHGAHFPGTHHHHAVELLAILLGEPALAAVPQADGEARTAHKQEHQRPSHQIYGDRQAVRMKYGTRHSKSHHCNQNA